MDLSGMIFAALAVGWAVYLIPKALQQHDELARSRSVDRFSRRMRVLGGGVAAAPARDEAPVVLKPPVVARPTLTRESARRAARRRRRVLYFLTFALVVVAGLAWQLVVPWWSTAVPGGLIVVFLVIARLTVRAERARRAPTATAGTPATVESAILAEQPERGVDAGDIEDTVGVSRDELAAAVAQPVADEGSLWDPLPMTLPTYVNKPRARRTVRTIELTQTGVSSSGHSEADSALVREAEALDAATSAASTAADSTASADSDDSDQRRAAGA